MSSSSSNRSAAADCSAGTRSSGPPEVDGPPRSGGRRQVARVRVTPGVASRPSYVVHATYVHLPESGDEARTGARPANGEAEVARRGEQEGEQHEM